MRPVDHSPLVWLAIRNLTGDRRRFVVTVLALGFCVFLVVFQASLLVGFLRAASRIVNGMEADLFIVPRGVPCIEFAAQLPDSTAHFVKGLPGVVDVARGVAGFTNWTTARGSRQVVLVVGIEPLPSRRSGQLLPTTLGFEQVAVDQSNLEMLELDGRPADIEINGHSARFARVVTGFGSFMGSPYVFAQYEDARRWLGIPRQATNFIAIRTVDDGAAGVVRLVKRRFADADVYEAGRFATTSESFWLTRTGAGGGLLVAALLGVLVGAAILSQTLYAITLDHLPEFVTLRAIGAPDSAIRFVVAVQALICGLAGWVIGTIISIPLVRGARVIVPWIHPVWWLPLVALVATLILCVVASFSAVRAVLRLDPADIFSNG